MLCCCHDSPEYSVCVTGFSAAYAPPRSTLSARAGPSITRSETFFIPGVLFAAVLKSQIPPLHLRTRYSNTSQTKFATKIHDSQMGRRKKKKKNNTDNKCLCREQGIIVMIVVIKAPRGFVFFGYGFCMLRCVAARPKNAIFGGR